MTQVHSDKINKLNNLFNTTDTFELNSKIKSGFLNGRDVTRLVECAMENKNLAFDKITKIWSADGQQIQTREKSSHIPFWIRRCVHWIKLKFSKERGGLSGTGRRRDGAARHRAGDPGARRPGTRRHRRRGGVDAGPVTHRLRPRRRFRRSPGGNPGRRGRRGHEHRRGRRRHRGRRVRGLGRPVRREGPATA